MWVQREGKVRGPLWKERKEERRAPIKRPLYMYIPGDPSQSHGCGCGSKTLYKANDNQSDRAPEIVMDHGSLNAAECNRRL